jgi:protein SCO1/2
VSKRLIIALSAAAVLSLAAIVVAALGMRGSGDDSSSAQTPAAVVHGPASPFEGASLPPGARAPKFSLRDQDGERVTMREYRGKPVIATFLYSHCKEECPAQAQQIKGALDKLGRDLPALAVSVDPAGDTPSSVKRFNRKQGVSGRIRWVLGSEAQLKKVWKGFATTSQTDGQEHLARIVLIDKRGFQRVGYPLREVTPDRLAHDLRILGREKA